MIDVALGGRAAEEMIFGREDVTSGCSSDLQRATDVAARMIRVTHAVVENDTPLNRVVRVMDSATRSDWLHMGMRRVSISPERRRMRSRVRLRCTL